MMLGTLPSFAKTASLETVSKKKEKENQLYDLFLKGSNNFL